MDVTRIKFCGLTSRHDAELALDAGAWAIGLIFWPGSKRKVKLEQAVEIAASVRRQVEVVGVFVNPSLEHVVRVADTVGLSMVQLHGEEGPAFCSETARRTGCRVIKAARVRSGAEIQALWPYHTDFHLLDSHTPEVPGGSGETFAWDLARGHRGAAPLILSGGLTPENVGEAIAIVRPYAVDVATGVEAAPGVKDLRKLEAFAAAVSRASAPTAA